MDENTQQPDRKQQLQNRLAQLDESIIVLTGRRELINDELRQCEITAAMVRGALQYQQTTTTEV